jgi:hypothetical protein
VVEENSNDVDIHTPFQKKEKRKKEFNNEDIAKAFSSRKVKLLEETIREA